MMPMTQVCDHHQKKVLEHFNDPFLPKFLELETRNSQNSTLKVLRTWHSEFLELQTQNFSLLIRSTFSLFISSTFSLLISLFFSQFINFVNRSEKIERLNV